jgi:hypothetical protein
MGHYSKTLINFLSTNVLRKGNGTMARVPYKQNPE